MRRLPVFCVFPISCSMLNKEREIIEEILASLLVKLRTDPYAVETAHLALIGYNDKTINYKKLTSICEFDTNCLSKFKINEGDEFSDGVLNFVLEALDKDIQKDTSEIKGDWKPVIVFVFLDSQKNTISQTAIQKFRNHKCSTVGSINVGANITSSQLEIQKKITDNIFLYQDNMDFSRLFLWPSEYLDGSIKTFE